METGMVKTKIKISLGEMESIMLNEPTTVMTLDSICTRSLDSEALMVSMSYDKTLRTSPMAWLS